MRELRFVRRGDDGAQLVVEPAGGGEQFTLTVDDSVRAAVLASSTPPPTTNKPTLAPREIQTRVRAGEDAAVIAAESGMTLEKVLRFAAPVLEERRRLTDEARRSRARRATPEGQLVNFGEYVDTRFAAHGVDPAGILWDSYRDEDGQWLIKAAWRGGETDRTALWSFSLINRTVAPMDDTAADLLSDKPIRPAVTPTPKRSRPPESGPRLGPDAETGPLPRVVEPVAEPAEDVYDQERDGSAAPSEPTEQSEPDWDEPPLPLRLAEPPEEATEQATEPEPPSRPAAKPRKARPTVLPERADETEEQKASRARVPSWDDILLGVRRKRD